MGAEWCNKEVFIAADNIISPLGYTTAENFEKLKRGISGVKKQSDRDISEHEFSASLFDKAAIYAVGNGPYTKFERLLIASITSALKQTDIDVTNPQTGLIISTTKGNISLLETEEFNEDLKKRISLHASASLIKKHFGFEVKPVVISNACISGVVAILTAVRMIRAGKYTHVVVAGADVISKFIFSGFESFHALSAEQCRPFDKDRTGLNLGEGAATVILSADQKYSRNIKILNGAVSDDANHISGPSRTGEELGHAIKMALQSAGISASQVDMISAHGTATSYNDDMEASAITFAGLAAVPVTGLKGYYGHTLGAAGLIECIITAEAMKQNVILPTIGFDEIGTKPININNTIVAADLNYCLKTASGFGGCNAALILSK